MCSLSVRQRIKTIVPRQLEDIFVGCHVVSEQLSGPSSPPSRASLFGRSLGWMWPTSGQRGAPAQSSGWQWHLWGRIPLGRLSTEEREPSRKQTLYPPLPQDLLSNGFYSAVWRHHNWSAMDSGWSIRHFCLLQVTTNVPFHCRRPPIVFKAKGAALQTLWYE